VPDCNIIYQKLLITTPASVTVSLFGATRRRCGHYGFPFGDNR
jgi:hypothetical protein